jgi:hypothetical protein
MVGDSDLMRSSCRTATQRAAASVQVSIQPQMYACWLPQEDDGEVTNAGR